MTCGCWSTCGWPALSSATTTTPKSYDKAEEAFNRARILDPGDEPLFWYASGQLVQLGRLEEGAELLRPLFERAPQWKELLIRLELPTAKRMREYLGL